MRETEYREITTKKREEVTTKITCDYCGKEIKEKMSYLYIGSEWPEECEGDFHDFCSPKCLGNFIKELDIETFSSLHNSIDFKRKVSKVYGSYEGDE